MNVRSSSNRITFRYRMVDSATGVTRDTARKIAEKLAVGETHAIHIALYELASKLLPRYEADEGPLKASQIQQLKKQIPQGSKRTVRSSLFKTG